MNVTNIRVASGGMLPFNVGGTGNIGVAVNLNSTGDVIAPGNSPGIQPYGTGQTWSSFTYEWETNNFTGTTAGTDFDQIQITGGLDLTGAAAGAVPNFAEVKRNWDMLTATRGITGFNANYRTIDHRTGPNLQIHQSGKGSTQRRNCAFVRNSLQAF